MEQIPQGGRSYDRGPRLHLAHLVYAEPTLKGRTVDGTPVRMQAWYDSHTMREHAGEIHVDRYEPA